MNIAKSKPLSKRLGVRIALSVVLASAITISQCRACDFCVQIPRVPFAVDQLAAIEVALATRSAANEGLIELNPVVVLAGHRNQEISLADLPPARLVSDWIATRPARSNRSLRCVCEVVFVDTDAAFRFDVRMGEIIGSDSTGPSDLRIVTTKAGFVRLLKFGLANCEDEKLAIVETSDTTYRDGLARLFPGVGDPTTSAVTVVQHHTDRAIAAATMKSSD